MNANQMDPFNYTLTTLQSNRDSIIWCIAIPGQAMVWAKLTRRSRICKSVPIWKSEQYDEQRVNATIRAAFRTARSQEEAIQSHAYENDDDDKKSEM